MVPTPVDSPAPAAPEFPTCLVMARPGRQRLPMLLRRCWFNLNQTFRRRIAHLGVTPDQFTALRSLVEGNPKGLTQRELTDAMTSDPNTVTSLLERMAAADWVARQAHESDRRANRIRLLPAGRKKYEAAREIALELQTEILAVLPLDKREEFMIHLEMVGEACQLAAARTAAKAEN